MKKRHLAKKAVAVTMAALMAAGALTACSSGSGETEAAADSGDTADEGAADSGSTEGVTINFRYWADNTEYSQLMQDIVAKFNAENGKGITVVAEESPWDGGAYSENLSHAKMGGGDIDCATA